MALQLAVLFGYSLAIIGFGLWLGRNVRSSGDFFVAGRKLSPFLLFSTLLAANIGAGSTVGAAGLGYKDGLSAWWWVGSAGIGSLVLGLWVGPRIWAIAAQHNLHTLGDYLELRYGRATRGLVSSMLWLGTLAILAGQLIALSWVLNVVAGTPKFVGCLLGGLVMTIYFAAGGLWGSAWVNMIQLTVLLGGFLLAIPLAFAETGGWMGFWNETSRQGNHYTSFLGPGNSGLHYLALLAPAFVVSPGLIQKVYGGRSASTVRKAVVLQGLALLLFAFFPPMLGMVARLVEPGLASPELALPTVFAKVLPFWVGTLGLAALFSAEVSSADAILFMLSTSLSKDLYKRFLRPDADDRSVLKIARRAAIAAGFLGVILAILIPTVVSALTLFYSLLSVSLFVPVVGGLALKRGGQVEAISAIGCGIAVTLAVQLSSQAQSYGIQPTTAGILASLVAFLCVLAARLRGRREAPSR